MKRVALSVCVCSVVFGTFGLAEAKERNRCCTTQAVGCAPTAQGVSVGCNSGRMLSYIEALQRAEDANRAEAALAAAKREIAQLKATLETTIAERDSARAAEEEARKIADLERARGTEALQ